MFCHMICLDDGYAGSKVMDMQLSGRRKWERPKMMYLDMVREDMREVRARDDEVFGCGEGGHVGGRSEGR